MALIKFFQKQTKQTAYPHQCCAGALTYPIFFGVLLMCDIFRELGGNIEYKIIRWWTRTRTRMWCVLGCSAVGGKTELKKVLLLTAGVLQFLPVETNRESMAPFTL